MKHVITSAAQISDAQVRDMYALMSSYYANLQQSTFRNDLANKDCIILLYDQRLIGFTSFQLIELVIDNRELTGVFSGNTIMAKGYAVGSRLQRLFIQCIDELRRRIERPLYWFLLCKGYKTYRYLGMYFKQYYPRQDVVTPAFEQAIMSAYARRKYGEHYDEARGIIVNGGQFDYLKKSVSPIDDKALNYPETRYFIDVNPGHIKGDELVCLAEFSDDNLKRGYFRAVKR